MKSTLRWAMALALLLVPLAMGGFTACKDQQSCMHCGEKFSSSELMGHQLSCKKNKTNMKMNKPAY